jgi:trans-aconitate methyltransferase
MKRLANIYNKVAETYAMGDRFNTIADSHDIAIQQIRSSIPSENNLQGIELGVGHGNFIKKIQPFYPNTHWTGVDLSSEMLSLTQTNIGIATVESSIQNIHTHTKAHQFDLIVAHYVCAYTGLNELLKQSSYLSKPQAYLSFITTTFNCFPVAQSMFKNTTWKTPLRKIASLAAEYHLHRTTVPKNADNIRTTLEANGYEILHMVTSERPIVLEDRDEALDFMISGGWAVELLNQRYFPQSIAMAITRFAFSLYEFPHHDKTVVEICLARKK